MLAREGNTSGHLRAASQASGAPTAIPAAPPKRKLRRLREGALMVSPTSERVKPGGMKLMINRPNGESQRANVERPAWRPGPPGARPGRHAGRSRRTYDK